MPYTPPDATAVDLTLDSGYTAPEQSTVDFDIAGDAGTATVTAATAAPLTADMAITVTETVPGTASTATPLTATETVVSDTKVWETTSDWDNTQSETGVVHEAVTNTDHSDSTIVKQGYSTATPFNAAATAAYYPLHEDSGTTAYDFSGNDNGATYQNSPSLGDAGLLGTTAPTFNGTDQYATVPDHNALDLGGSGALAAWFRCTESNTNFGTNKFVYIANDANPDSYGLYIHANDGSLVGFMRNSSGNLITGGDVRSSAAFDDSTWHHGVVTYDGTDLTLYVDGTDVATATDSGQTIAEVTQVSYIGQHGDTNSRWPGQLADVRVFNTGLTAAEVQTLYETVTTSGTLTTAVK